MFALHFFYLPFPYFSLDLKSTNQKTIKLVIFFFNICRITFRPTYPFFCLSLGSEFYSIKSNTTSNSDIFKMTNIHTKNFKNFILTH